MSWRAVLAAFCAVRIGIPLVALAATGHDLRVVPRYDYGPFTGDAPAYYSTARALISALAGPAALGLALAVAGAAGSWWLRRRSPALALLSLALGISLAATAVVARSGASPAGAVGWSLLWAVPLLPLRALHAAGHDGAFASGLVLSLAANAATVVATAYAGLYATRRRSVAVAAAGLVALFPLWMWLLHGASGWGNGTWATDAGLHLTTEPLSTALVAVGCALVLGRLTPLRLACAGLALGYAFTVRPTNGIVGVAALAYVVWRERRAAWPLVAGAAVVAPIWIAFLPKRTGYELKPVADAAGALFSSSYFGSSWADSILWGPRALAILVPVALLGASVLRRRPALLLLGVWALSNPAVYSFARATSQHPRYLFASLPAVLVLWAAGAIAVVTSVRGRTVNLS